MVPPLPAPSRPSNTMQSLSPLCTTHCCSLTSSTCSLRSSRSYALADSGSLSGLGNDDRAAFPDFAGLPAFGALSDAARLPGFSSRRAFGPLPRGALLAAVVRWPDVRRGSVERTPACLVLRLD